MKDELAEDRRVWTFDARDADEATRLRHEIMLFLQGHAERVDGAASELILGELLGNVVKHTPGFAEVTVRCNNGRSRLCVADRGPGFVASHDLPANPLAESGRGLFLVYALAREVQIRTAPGGGSQVDVALPTALPA